MNRVVLERAPLTQQIERALEASAAGAGVVVHVDGPAGIGKSTLLSHARDAGLAAGMEVLTARGGELERDYPFGAVRQLFERRVRATPHVLAGSAALAAAAIEPRPDAAAGDVHAALHGLYWLTANLAERSPLLLVCDDAHFVDPASLRFLAYLAHRIADLPVALCVAARSTEPGSDAAALAALREHAVRVTPRPLSERAVATLVATAYDTDAHDGFSRACHQVTGGNPLFVGELLRGLLADGVPPVAASVDTVRSMTTDALRAHVAARLARLGEPARRLGRALAVAAGDGTGWHVAELAGLGGAQAAAAAAELLAAGFLDAADSARFAHPVLREALYADIAAPQRSRLHARAAELLAAHAAPPETVAVHLLAVEPAGKSDRVAALQAAAGAASRRGAPDVGATYLRRALAEPPPSAARGRILAQLGAAEMATAHPDAIAHLTEALGLLDDDEERAPTGRLLAIALGQHRGDWAGALDVLQDLLDQLPADRRDARLSVMSDIVAQEAMVAAGQPETAGRAIAREVAGLAGDTAAERELLAVFTMQRVWRGACTAPEALAIVDRALGRGALVAEGRPDSVALGVVLHALIVAEGFAAAGREIDRALLQAQREGSFFGYAMCTVMRNISALRRGLVGPGDTDPQQIVDNALELESPIGIGVAAPTGADILRERGQLDEARALLRRAGLAGELPPAGWFATALESRGRLKLALGDAAGALQDLLEAGERVAQWRATNPAVVPWRSSAALAHLALGDRDAAIALADEEVALSAAFAAPRAHGIALRARALCAGGAEQIARLQEAADVLARSEARLEHARALVELGAAHRRANARAEAQGHLRAALELARRCDAQALCDQALVELRATGARPRRAAVTGADALTASERRVVGMAAEGWSNREIAQALFVSTRTVETHLQRAYGKLQITSRTQLPAALSAAPGSSPPPSA